MSNHERITQLIFSGLDEINFQLEPDKVLEKSLDTVLFGKSAKLDSMALVTLIVAVEEKVEEEFGVLLTIADERALSQKNSPFRTVTIFADYISLLLKEHSN